MADETVELSTLEVSSALLTPTLTYDWVQGVETLEVSSVLLAPSIALGYVVILETLALEARVLTPTIPIPKFPTLTVKPSVKKFSQSLLFDPVHRARMGSGAILSRPTESQTPDEYGISYSLMPDADKLVLETWVENEIGNGGLRFEWTNIANGKTYVSILLKPISYTIHPRSKGDYWKVDISIAAIYEAL